MRKLVLGLVFLIAVSVVLNAQEIVYTDTAVLEWDAVTTLENGDPIPPADTVTYEVVYAEQTTHANIVFVNTID